MRRVVDGDTVDLSDRRRLRLVGIDTPELGHGRSAEPLATEARRALSGLAGKTVGLVYSPERRDRYGRWLAHLFLNDGTNVQRWMLSEGLASALFLSPSPQFQDCYAEAERQARKARRGIWGLARYQPLDVTRIGRWDEGLRVITGTVMHSARSKSGLRLRLGPRMVLYITTGDLRRFPPFDSRGMLGRRVYAQGWMSRRGGHWTMRIRHPAHLWYS
ncbi:MAG: thermonuclease family protein [Gammaproteobacteria bacterium]